MNWLINDPMVIWGEVRWILPVDWCDDREKCEFGKWPPIILIWSSLFSKDFSMRLTCGTSTAVRIYVVPWIINTKLYLYDKLRFIDKYTFLTCAMHYAVSKAIIRSIYTIKEWYTWNNKNIWESLEKSMWGIGSTCFITCAFDRYLKTTLT